MDFSGLSLIVDFYQHIDIFLLIFVRVVAFLLLAPVISGMNIPLTVRITLALCIAFVIFMSGAVSTVVYNNSVAGYVYLILMEVLTGIVIGFVLFCIFNIILFTGQLIDYQIGLSMMSVMDPMLQMQVPIVGNLYYLAVSAMLVVSGGLRSFIGAFFYSYQVLPVGGAWVIGNQQLVTFFLEVMLDFFNVGVKIALPIVGSILVIDAALGIMVKAVPQMNIFVVGMPIKLLVGLLLLLTVMVPTFGVIYDYLFNMAYEAIIDVIWGMAP